MKKVTFKLPAAALQRATEAKLLGDFNDWDTENGYPLKKNKNGDFEVAIDLEAGKTYEYRFLLNDGRWENDWSAQAYHFNEALGIHNSVITIADAEGVAAVKEAPAKKAVAKKAAPAKTATAPKKEVVAKEEKAPVKKAAAKKAAPAKKAAAPKKAAKK